MNIVERFVSGFLDTNSYRLEEDRHLLIIDPADHAAVMMPETALGLIRGV